jgi:predicted DNA-binding ribbon-helix-helix protein
VRKYSVQINGHATSLSLEPAFWEKLRAIATSRGVSMNALVAETDAERMTRQDRPNLSSALRLLVLQDLEQKLQDRGKDL